MKSNLCRVLPIAILSGLVLSLTAPFSQGKAQRLIVIIDRGVEDYELLLEDLRSSGPAGLEFEVVLLDRDRDGIAEALD